MPAAHRSNASKRDLSPAEDSPVKAKRVCKETKEFMESPLSTTSTLNSGESHREPSKDAKSEPVVAERTVGNTGQSQEASHDGDGVPLTDGTSKDASGEPSVAEHTAGNNHTHEALVGPYQCIVNTLVPLPRIQDYIKSREMPERVPTVNIGHLFSSNLPVVQHVIHLAFAPSKENLVNLALIDPMEFALHSERVVHTTLVAQSFFIIGSVVYSDLFNVGNTKQICIQPLHFLWPRVAAVIGRIFDVSPGSVLLNNGFQGGLSFSSWLKGDRNKSSSAKSFPVNRRWHGPTIRPWNEPVPIFDCRSRFKLSTYNTAPKYTEDPENGSIVLIIFTLGRYKELSYKVASYNIQVILKLTNSPTEGDGEPARNPLSANLSALEPIGVCGSDEGADDFIPPENEAVDPAEASY
ncbi:uncharacterized protein EV420DRAFT_1474913 [Desarmillaria tabescens]|uniref:Uncharacterized protein n=1 Tax=Armillaria tabescens TaxID=1929756 RepID=A0AA39NI82_ARMTA|nr:uncharacterized protein EV420DRAFT_1474913 [Desarmillaria tabescens]KAK0466115.1 hypothetical protein EV420DRAFT_1474913 [Desarmillaria tabescens]